MKNYNPPLPEIRRVRKSLGVEEVVRGVAEYYGLSEIDLLRRRRRTEAQRKIAVYLSKGLSGEKNVSVGAAFGISIQAVTNAVRRVEKMVGEDNRFSSKVMRLKEIVGGVK